VVGVHDDVAERPLALLVLKPEHPQTDELRDFLARRWLVGGCPSVDVVVSCRNQRGKLDKKLIRAEYGRESFRIELEHASGSSRPLLRIGPVSRWLDQRRRQPSNTRTQTRDALRNRRHW